MYLNGGIRYSGNRRLLGWRKRLAKERVSALIPAILVLLLCSAVSVIAALVGLLRTEQHTPTSKHKALLPHLACKHVEAKPLHSFDAHMLQRKASGQLAVEFENRHQETVWGTLEVSQDSQKPTGFFPAWSDKMWYVGEYGRGLFDDLQMLRQMCKRMSQSAAPSLHYVHTRLDRLRGLQFAGAFEAQPGKEMVFSLTRRIEDKDCSIETRKVEKSERVHILLPYSRRAERLGLFFENIKFLREQRALDVVVVVCILQGEEEDVAEVERLRTKFLDGISHADAVRISLNRGDADGKFSRGVALREAAKTIAGGDVLFMCDVDMIVLPRFVERCHRNAILGSQVFYPVFYSLFPYANAEPRISQRNGFWRVSSFGMVCIRNEDFRSVDPFGDAEVRFQGWGSEDTYMFEKIRNSTNLVAFRSVEPGLLHRWHSKRCDKGSKAYWDCMKTNFATMGHPLRIGPTIVSSFQDEEDLFRRLQQA